MSAYTIFGNNPIMYKDVTGNDYAVYIDHDAKTIIVKASYYTLKEDKDAFISALNATAFWNSLTGNYNYQVGKGSDALIYSIKFQQDVLPVDNVKKMLNDDKDSEFLKEDECQNISDGSSNSYQILPDDDNIFVSDDPKISKNGITRVGIEVFIKESRKSSDTGPHEVGHTNSTTEKNKHSKEGIMTEKSSSPLRYLGIMKENLEFLIKNALNNTGDAKGTIIETGARPDNFDKGKINETNKK